MGVQKIKVSIIIPCYNEYKNLKFLIFSAKKLKEKFNFIFVDNGSTDLTDSFFKKNKIPQNCKYIKIKKNIGYGNGIKVGLKKAKNDYLGWMHGDQQQKLAILDNVYKIINEKKLNKNFLIKGLRTKRKIFDLFFTVGMAILMTIVFKKRHWDVAGQPTIISKKNLKVTLKAPNDFSFDFCIYNFFVMNNYHILRFQAPFLRRKFGVSSWDQGITSKVKHSIKIIKYIFKLKKTIKNFSKD